MKKLMILAMAALFTVSANAQVRRTTSTYRKAPSRVVQKRETTFLRPMVGINMANITNSEADMKLGLNAGAEVMFEAAPKFAVSVGALYSMQGAKYSESGITAKLNLDYINIPVLANFYVAEGFALKAGIQLGFKASAKEKYEGGGVSESEDLGSAVEGTTFAIPLGFSYDFSDFFIDGRYNLGITNWAKGGDSKHSVFSVTLGYKFPL